MTSPAPRRARALPPPSRRSPLRLRAARPCDFSDAARSLLRCGSRPPCDKAFAIAFCGIPGVAPVSLVRSTRASRSALGACRGSESQRFSPRGHQGGAVSWSADGRPAPPAARRSSGCGLLPPTPPPGLLPHPPVPGPLPVRGFSAQPAFLLPKGTRRDSTLRTWEGTQDEQKSLGKQASPSVFLIQDRSENSRPPQPRCFYSVPEVKLIGKACTHMEFSLLASWGLLLTDQAEMLGEASRNLLTSFYNRARYECIL